MMNINESKIATVTGTLLAGLTGLIFAVQTLLFFFNLSIGPASVSITGAACILLAALYLYHENSLPGLAKLYTALAAILLVAIAVIVSGFFIDYSYDGQSYHGEAIRLLRNGWNPTYQHLPDNGLIITCVNHFAKSSWVVGGVFYALTGCFEYAKSTNLILMFANFFLCYPFFKTLFKKSWVGILCALLISVNPIFLNMYLSNMIDSQVASSVFIIIILLASYLETREKPVLILLYLMIFYSVNLKFTLVGYYLVFGLGLILYLKIKNILNQHWKLLAHIALAFGLGIFLFGYNTYVKNTVEHQHPFYPFKGEYNQYTVNTIFDAYDYREGNRALNFIKSNFARTTFLKAHTEPLEYKFPFMFNRYELERYAFAGVLIGGFGVWYSAIILISLIVIAAFFAGKKSDITFTEKLTLLSLLGIIAGSILINPLCYIARYIPQYYLIPFIALYLAWHYFKNKPIFGALAGILIVNSLLICGYTFYNFVASSNAKRQLYAIKQMKQPLSVNFGNHLARRATFDDLGIKYREVQSFPVSNIPDTLFRSEVTFLPGK